MRLQHLMHNLVFRELECSSITFNVPGPRKNRNKGMTTGLEGR